MNYGQRRNRKSKRERRRDRDMLQSMDQYATQMEKVAKVLKRFGISIRQMRKRIEGRHAQGPS